MYTYIFYGTDLYKYVELFSLRMLVSMETLDDRYLSFLPAHNTTSNNTIIIIKLIEQPDVFSSGAHTHTHSYANTHTYTEE